MKNEVLLKLVFFLILVISPGYAGSRRRGGGKRAKVSNKQVQKIQPRYEHLEEEPLVKSERKGSKACFSMNFFVFKLKVSI